jgi:uncharacterized BrkB/YihY/UPF0761 family membrane protein
VSALLAFLVWAYLSGIIFLFGAFLSLAYFQFRQKQKEMEKSRPASSEL